MNLPPPTRFCPAVCLLLPMLVAGVASAAEAGTEVYRKDVEFLLTELPRNAGRFFAIKQIDWTAVSNDFSARVLAVTNDTQHLKLCQHLLAQLKDGHARLTDLKVTPPDESKGRGWTGPRVHLLLSGTRVFVGQAFGSAATQGVETGMEVLRVDELPARQWVERRATEMAGEGGYSTTQQVLYAACHWGLAGWSGTPISFELLKSGQTNRVTLVRSGGSNYAPSGPVFPPPGLQGIGRQSYGKSPGGFGYIHLRDVPGNLPEQLDTMLAAVGKVPGLILDMRANGGGGCDHAAVFGRFLARGQSWRNYTNTGTASFDGPMVVIVDAGTRSAGETIAGMFKEDGRAYMIGDSATAGMSSSKTTLPLPSGLFSVYFSVRSNMGRFNGGRGIEGIGVPPHELLNYHPDDLARGVDTPIRRAEALLQQGLPVERVPYAAAAPSEAAAHEGH